jgi:hypothetical protein
MHLTSPRRNYSEFVEISKEIATLENEMIELRTVLEEWKAVPASLEIATDSTSHMTHDFGLVARAWGTPRL